MTAPAQVDTPTATTTIADPGPLGLAAFALTTFMLSLANAGLVEAAVPAVLGLALFYGGATQLVAGAFEFVKGNTFGATAFSSYGAFWMTLWYLITNDLFGDPKTAGWFLFAWGIFTLYMLIASLKTNGALVAVFFVLTVTFFLLAFADLGGSETLKYLGGYFGLLTAALAWYVSFAGVAKSTFGRDVLPVFPRN